MYRYFVCQCERKNVTNYNMKTRLTLRLILISERLNVKKMYI